MLALKRGSVALEASHLPGRGEVLLIPTDGRVVEEVGTSSADRRSRLGNLLLQPELVPLDVLRRLLGRVRKPMLLDDQLVGPRLPRNTPGDRATRVALTANQSRDGLGPIEGHGLLRLDLDLPAVHPQGVGAAAGQLFK